MQIISTLFLSNYLVDRGRFFLIGSDINGDNSWGGPGEMSGSSDLFQITDTNVTVDINLAPEKTGVANSAPVITSTPTTVAFVGSTYIYGVDASDADGDDLTYAMTVYDSYGNEVDSFLSFGAFPWPATYQERQLQMMLVCIL